MHLSAAFLILVAFAQQGDQPPPQPVAIPTGFATPSGETDLTGLLDVEAGKVLENRYDDDAGPKIVALLRHRHPEARKEAAECIQYLDNLPAGSVAGLIPLLRDPNASVRSAAADTLGEIDPKFALPAIDALTAAIDDPDHEVFNMVVAALANIGEPADKASPKLISLIRDREYGTQAIRTLGFINGPEAKKAIPILVPLFGRGFGDSDIARTLGRMGAEAPLLAILKSESSQRAAADGLRFVHPHSKLVVPALVKLANTTDDYTARVAIETLGYLRPTSEEIVTELNKFAKDEDEDLRVAAMEAMTRIEPKLESALPTILAGAQDENDQVRAYAAEAVKGFKGKPRAVLASQAIAICDDDWSVRNSAEVRLTEEEQKDFPILVEYARDHTADVRLQSGAIFLVGLNRSDREEEVDALMRELLSDKKTRVAPAAYAANQLARADWDNKTDPDVRKAMLAALDKDQFPAVQIIAMGMMGDDSWLDAVPDLIVLTNSKTNSVRDRVVGILGEIGDARAVPRLCEIASDPDAQSRYGALASLGKIAGGAEQSIPVLLKVMKEENSYHPTSAASALANLVRVSEGDGREILKEAVPLLESKRSVHRSAALQLIAELPEDTSKDAVDQVIPRLNDEEGSVQTYAIKALGSIGSQAGKAMPTLVKMIDNPKSDNYRVGNLIDAMGDIGGDSPIAVTAITKRLSDEDHQYDCLSALEKFGPNAKTALPVLGSLLSSSEESVRRKTLEVITAIGPAEQSIALLLKSAKDDPAEYNRTLTGESLLRIAPTDARVVSLLLNSIKDDPDGLGESVEYQEDKLIGPLVSAGMKHSDAEIRAIAMRMVTDFDDPSFAKEGLLIALDDTDDEIRMAAAFGLVGTGVRRDKVVPIIVNALRRDDAELFDQIENSVYEFGRRGTAALVELATDKTAPLSARVQACRFLYEQEMAARYVSPLKQIAEQEEGDLAMWAAIVVANGDAEQGDAEQLLLALKSDNPELVESAASSLAQVLQVKSNPMVADRVKQALFDLLKSDKLGEYQRQDLAYNLGQCNLNEDDVENISGLLKKEDAIIPVLTIFNYRDRPFPDFTDELIVLLSNLDEYENGEEIASLVPAVLAKIGEPAIVPVTKLVVDGKNNPEIARYAVEVLIQLEDLPRPTLKALADATASEDEALRFHAAVALGRQGIAHPRVFGPLIEGLKVDDYNYPDQIESAIQGLGDKAKLLGPDLLAALNDSDDEYSVKAAELLSKLSPDSAEVASAIAARAAKADSDYYNSYAWTLVNFGKPAVEPLVRLLGSDDTELVSAVAETFQSMNRKDCTAAIPALLKVSKNEDLRVALAAATSLALLDEETLEPNATILRALKSEDRYIMSNAHSTISAMGPRAAPMVEFLVPMLDDEEVHYMVFNALNEIGPAAVPAVPKLIPHFETDMHYQAVNIIRVIGEPAAEAAPALIDSLQNERYFEYTVSALAQLGPAGLPAIPLLIKMLDDPYRDQEAAQALANFKENAAPAVEALEQKLSESELPDLQAASAYALGAIGKPAERSIPALSIVAKSSSLSVARPAIRALGNFDSPAAVEALTSLLGEPNERSSTVLWALSSNNEAISVGDVVPYLDHEKTTYAACMVLGNMGEKAVAATPKLTSMIADPKNENRRPVVMALGEIGPGAKAALPALEAMVKTSKGYEKRMCEEAIWKIAAGRAKELGFEPLDEEDE